MGRRYEAFKEDTRTWYESMTVIPSFLFSVAMELIREGKGDYNDRDS